jgi:hypothetical protein
VTHNPANNVMHLPGPKPRKPPVMLRIALLVVGVEVLALLALGVAELAALSTLRLAMGLSTAAFFFIWGLALAWCARGMWRADSTGRSIVVLAQLIQLGVAWSYRSSTPDISAWLAITGLVTLVGIFWPASLRWFEQEETDQEEVGQEEVGQEEVAEE